MNADKDFQRASGAPESLSAFIGVHLRF